MPLGVCLRRDRSCVTGLRLRWFGRLKLSLVACAYVREDTALGLLSPQHGPAERFFRAQHCILKWLVLPRTSDTAC